MEYDAHKSWDCITPGSEETEILADGSNKETFEGSFPGVLAGLWE